MKLAVFGLGYVGCVSAACFARDGHTVVGVDTNPGKVSMFNRGCATIIEMQVDELIRTAWEQGRLSATQDGAVAVSDADLSLVCVGTPSLRSGHLDTERIFSVAQTIGLGLRWNPKYHVVLIRSTAAPATNARVADIIAKDSGKRRGTDFEVATNPEFLREGTAVYDFDNPPITVIGTDSVKAFALASELYSEIQAPIRRVDIATAEMIKLVNNAWHALKVAFANEVGMISKSIGVDSHELMSLFCQDSKLNLSSYYLKPGFAFGGSCLPKDLKALAAISHDNYLSTPVLNAIEPSNREQKHRLVELVVAKGYQHVGILGFSFKSGTDDLRSSPMVEIAETLLGKGFSLKIYDKNVHLSNLTGTNREYIMSRIPHLADLISNDLDNVMRQSQLVIVANKEHEFNQLLSRWPDKHVVDLVRLDEGPDGRQGKYDGVAW